MKFLKLILFILILLLVQLSVYAQVEDALITVLSLEGDVDYIRSGWTEEQVLLPGSLIRTDDVIFADNANLIVMCPDGRVRRFLQSELLSNDVVRCESDPNEYIVGTQGERRLSIQRGGRQDISVPYLISPRSTALRHNQIKLVWNPVLNVEHYTVKVWESNTVVWESDRLDPLDVADGDVARINYPLSLTEDISYTVEICVLFTNLQSGCTTDAGWNAAVTIAFQYVPNLMIDQRMQELADTLGDTTPEALYAQAILLAQPISTLSTPDNPIGYYAEAIHLLEQLQVDHPSSDIVNSPVFFNQLGELYRLVNLPLSATRAFNRASELAIPTTEPAAIAAVGRAQTTGTGDELAFYETALDSFTTFMQHDRFLQEFQGICGTIKDACLDLSYCEMPDADCNTWSTAG